MFQQLNGKDLDTALACADFLLREHIAECLDAELVVKLDTARADMTAEQEDRRKLARR